MHVDSNGSVVSDRSLSSVCNTDFTDLTLRVDDVTETTVNASMISVTRGSAIAEEPRDALRQFKYYGRFLTELLTRSSANPEEPCEHNVS